MTTIWEYDMLIKAAETALEVLKKERIEALFTTPLTRFLYDRPTPMLCTQKSCHSYAETTQAADGKWYHARDFPASLGYGPLCRTHGRDAKFKW